jgi:nitrite reductase/ring-hydroxylating ferredoxin subunit
MGEWIRVASVADLPPGHMLSVEVDGEWVALYNVDGTLYATQAFCTHAEADLTEGTLDGEIVECPLHGARFNVRTGEVLSMPAVVPLMTYPVKVEEGQILIEWE